MPKVIRLKQKNVLEICDTWTHIPATRQIIMAKTLHGNDGNLHTFRIAIDT